MLNLSHCSQHDPLPKKDAAFAGHSIGDSHLPTELRESLCENVRIVLDPFVAIKEQTNRPILGTIQ